MGHSLWVKPGEELRVGNAMSLSMTSGTKHNNTWHRGLCRAASRFGIHAACVRGSSQLLMFVLVGLGLGAGIGCASQRASNNVSIASQEYTAAFESARDVLREYKFTLERVDAQQGVITTAPKDSAGLATPWDTHQTYVSQDISDLVNHQQRRVRITFPDADVSLGAGKFVSVEVYVDRLHSPGLRVPSRATSLWTVSRDPVASARGVAYQYTVARERDTALEKRIADRVERRIRERANTT